MEAVRIGSFNLYKFSANSDKDLSCIANIIRDAKVDILAIQEIFSRQALNNLLIYLGTNWEGSWESPNSRSVSAAEGYAFVWNTSKISLSRNRSGKTFEPRIHNQYSHKDVELIRNPYYGRFILNRNEMCEIRLINTHIMFSQNRTVNESDVHDSSIELISDVKMRKRELDILSKSILPKIDDKVYDAQWDEIDGICRKPFTILLGDYNLNLRSSGAKDTFIDEPLIILRDANSEKHIITVQEELTTLKGKTADCPVIDGYRNNFDHFTYDSKRPIETYCWAIKAPTNPKFFNGDYNKYRDSVSDHLMVVMEIRFI